MGGCPPKKEPYSLGSILGPLHFGNLAHTMYYVLYTIYHILYIVCCILTMLRPPHLFKLPCAIHQIPRLQIIYYRIPILGPLILGKSNILCTIYHISYTLLHNCHIRAPSFWEAPTLMVAPTIRAQLYVTGPDPGARRRRFYSEAARALAPMAADEDLKSVYVGPADLTTAAVCACASIYLSIYLPFYLSVYI